MAREPWTLEELILVAEHPGLSDEELVGRLGNRGSIGLGIIRIGLHAYHRGPTGPAQRMFLPRVFRDYLGREDRPKVVCPKCGAEF